MKRLSLMLLAFAMMFSLLCACGKPDAASTPAATHSDPPVSDGPLDGGSAVEPNPTQEPSLALPPEAPSTQPPEAPSAEPSTGPAENPPASPAPSEPAAEPSLALPPEPEAVPSDELCNLPVAPSGEPGGAASEAPPTPAGGREVDLQAFYDGLVFDDPDFNATAELFGEYLDVYYPGLSAIPINQLVVYQPMMSAVVCEIALVEVQDSADVMPVIELLQARVSAQVGTEDEPGGAWYPASIEGWQNNSRIVSHGRYIMLIAYDKCDDVVAAFDALF